MNIQLSKSREIIMEPARTKTIDTIIIREIVDNPNDKRVVAYSNVGDIDLWSGGGYDNIGNWTNDDVIERVLNIYDQD